MLAAQVRTALTCLFVYVLFFTVLNLNTLHEDPINTNSTLHLGDEPGSTPQDPATAQWSEEKLAESKLPPQVYTPAQTIGCIAESRLCACLGKEDVKAGAVYKNLTGQLLASRKGWKPCNTIAHCQKPLVNVSVSGWLSDDIDKGMQDCPWLRCHLEDGKRFSEGTHVVLKVAVGNKTPTFRCKTHPEWQMSILLSMESSMQYPAVKTERYSADIDAMAGFRQYSTHKPHIHISFINANEQSFMARGALFEDRVPILGLFMSNCHQETHARQAFIGELARFVTVESYGSCSPPGTVQVDWWTRFPQCQHMQRRSAMWDAIKECVLFYS